MQVAAPAAEKNPDGQDTQVAEDVAPVAFDIVPAGHAIALIDARGQYAPSGQVTHVTLEDAPRAALNVPAGHGVGSVDESGQKNDAGQELYKKSRPADDPAAMVPLEMIVALNHVLPVGAVILLNTVVVPAAVEATSSDIPHATTRYPSPEIAGVEQPVPRRVNDASIIPVLADKRTTRDVVIANSQLLLSIAKHPTYINTRFVHCVTPVAIDNAIIFGLHAIIKKKPSALTDPPLQVVPVPTDHRVVPAGE